MATHNQVQTHVNNKIIPHGFTLIRAGWEVKFLHTRDTLVFKTKSQIGTADKKWIKAIYRIEKL